MNKADIKDNISSKYLSLGKCVVKFAVDKFFEILSNVLQSHNRVEFRDFGSFSIRSYIIQDHCISTKCKRNKYFRLYFRSSKILLDVADELKDSRNTNM